MWDWLISPSYELTNAVRADHMRLHYDGYLIPTPGRSFATYQQHHAYGAQLQ